MPRIREVRFTDLEDVVHIHLSAFDRFFLSSMGPSFLREFYKAVLLDKSNVAIIAVQGGSVAGFAVGTITPEGLYRRMLPNRGYRLLLASVLPILKQPQTVPRLLRRLLMAGNVIYKPGQALLMSLAVDPARQREGIGRDLVLGFLEEAKNRGATSVSLTTDRDGNETANQFYLRLGFSFSGSFKAPEARTMNEYRKMVC